MDIRHLMEEWERKAQLQLAVFYVIPQIWSYPQPVYRSLYICIEIHMVCHAVTVVLPAVSFSVWFMFKCRTHRPVCSVVLSNCCLLQPQMYTDSSSLATFHPSSVISLYLDTSCLPSTDVNTTDPSAFSVIGSAFSTNDLLPSVVPQIRCSAWHSTFACPLLAAFFVFSLSDYKPGRVTTSIDDVGQWS